MANLIFDILAVDKASSVIEGVSDTLKGQDGAWDKWKLAGIGATTAVVAALGAGLGAAMDGEAANDKLAASLGAPADYAADLGKVAGTLWAGAYGESLDEVNGAIKGVLQNGLVFEDATNEQMASVTASVMDVATAFDQDLGGVTIAVGQMMKTGLAPDAATALDIVTRGFQQGADKSDDFLMTLNEYGGQFSKLGIDGATATGLISQGLQAGARDGDSVADAIKEFAIRAVDGSKASGEAFKAMGLDAGDMTAQIASGGEGASAGLQTVLDSLRGMTDPVARNAAAVGIFGTKAEDLGAALFALDPSTAVGALGEVSGAAEEMGETLNDNATTDLTGFARQVKATFVDWLGEKALPVVKDVATYLNDNWVPAIAASLAAVSAFGAWFADSSDVIGAIAIPIGLFTAGIVALGIAQAVQTGAAAAWFATTSLGSVVMGVATAAQWLWNAAMTANPIGLIIVAVAALVAGIIWVATKTTWFQDLWRVVWGGIKAGAAAVANWFSVTVPAKFSAGWAVISAGATAMKNWIAGRFNAVVSFVSAVPGRIGRAASGIWGSITSGLDAAKNWVVGKFNALVGFVTSLPGRISSAAAGMFNGIKGAFKSAINWVISKWNNFELTIGGGTVLGVAIPSVTLATPNIPYLADGGTALRAGLAMVGERGPELLHLPVGASVIPLNGRPAAGVGNSKPTLHIEHYHAGPASASEVAAALSWEMHR